MSTTKKSVAENDSARIKELNGSLEAKAAQCSFLSSNFPTSGELQKGFFALS